MSSQAEPGPEIELFKCEALAPRLRLGAHCLRGSASSLLWYPEITYGNCDEAVEDINRDNTAVTTCVNSSSRKDGTSIPEEETEKVCFITRPCLSEPQKQGGRPRETIKWRIGGPEGSEDDNKTTNVYYYLCQPVIAGPDINLSNDDPTPVTWQPCKAYANCLREFKVNPTVESME